MDWIDTHCHLDAPEFDADRDAVVARARGAGVVLQVLPAVQVAHTDVVRGLAHRHGLAYALGIHPLYTPQAADDDLDRLDDALARHRDDPRLVAVGEIGLDGWVPGLDMARQQHFYRAQLKLAQRHGLPVLLHVRRAADALLQGLRRWPVAGGIAHAFNGSRQQADAFVGLGFALGFGGAMTFERALQIRRLAAELPDSALVLETDAPDIPPHWLYRTAAERAGAGMDGTGGTAACPQGNAWPPQVSLTPAGGGLGAARPWGRSDGAVASAGYPAARSGRNEPAELPRIAQTLAALRGWGLDQTAATTGANARRVLPRLAALGPVAAAG